MHNQFSIHILGVLFVTIVTQNMAAVLEDRDSEMANDMDEDGYILERILLKAFVILLNKVFLRFSVIKNIKTVAYSNKYIYIINLFYLCSRYNIYILPYLL